MCRDALLGSIDLTSSVEADPFDYHDASIATARNAAADAGVADRVTFEVAAAQSYPGQDYDLVAFFDCLHDMGDPENAALCAQRWPMTAPGCWSSPTRTTLRPG